MRGGSWNNNNPDNLRVAYRNNNRPANANDNIGFRVGFFPSTLKNQSSLHFCERKRVSESPAPSSWSSDRRWHD
ncbi:MAG TPA: hypothetical protein VJC18_07415 [bacterium]|nr:hypothetical protein [bacterium]